MSHDHGKNRSKGRVGETIAAEHLKNRGYRIVGKNYYARGGEIDLIAFDGRILVFVEVKARRDDRFGTGAEAVTSAKQERMVKAAMQYIMEYGYENFQCRFDVVEIMFLPQLTIELYQNAFP